MYKIAWLLLTCLSFDSSAAGQWLPLKDVSLMVESASILDFSKLLNRRGPILERVIVNKDGHFAIQDEPTKPVRFLMASLGFGVANGSFPDHPSAELYARQLRMHGYNMARLDYVEETLMHRRLADFDFDPDQLDRFYYLLFALKREGIYFVLNGLSSDNAAYGNIEERWNDQRHAKFRVYYDAEMQGHWKKLMDSMLASINPYTGISTLADPGLAGIIMVNEGGLSFVNRNGSANELRPLFSEWLRKKYRTSNGLMRVWKNELQTGESIEKNSVALAKSDAWTSQRMFDTQQFFVDLEKSTADWMTQYLRDLGYKGILTAYDNWISPATHLSRAQFDWVDLHNYFSEPTAFSSPGSIMRQDSMLQGGANYITELAAGKHIGKAFTISEYGQVFWNKYRRESALAVPAYASFQGWDMISQHAQAVDLSYARKGGRSDAIYPFMVSFDPISRANETLAALLFLRGDVSPATHTLGIKLTPDFAFKKNAFLSSISQDVSRLALVTGIGLDLEGNMMSAGKYTAQIELESGDVTVTHNSSNSSSTKMQSVASKASSLSGRMDSLRKAGLVDPNNRTDPNKGLYQTDTGEVTLDSRQKRLTVATPLTEAVVFDAPDAITLRNLTVEWADGPALVSVSSMDNQPLQNSKRMLVIFATDARNSGMVFTDTAETTLVKLGKLPVLMRTSMVKLKLRNSNASQLKVFSTTLGGKRGDSLPVGQENGCITVLLDTSKLSHGPTTYFEISVAE